jgi:hypothetical protein
VPTPPYNRLLLVPAALQLLPPSIRESLSSDPVFLKGYDLTASTQISIGDGGISVQGSKLYDCIREILSNRSASPTFKDEEGNEWRMDLVEIDDKLQVRLSGGKYRFLLPDHSALSLDQAERLKSFDRNASEVNLPEEATSVWRGILASRALADDEIDTLLAEIEETPNRMMVAVGSEMEAGKGKLSTLVPRSERYFDRLVGEYRQSQSVTEHVQVGTKEHIRQLMSWRAYDGFLLSLLLSSHSSISSEINTDQLGEKDIIQAYEWLQKEGDRISQIGAIEVGLSILDKRPEIEPYLQNIIRQIRDDDADNRGQFHLLSALIMLVEGELARTKLLRGRPVFWRRLASIAQASLIERCVIKSPIDIARFAEWALQARGQLFYLQAITDLRQEPRWLPDYVSPRQLKAEFIGRILSAARQNITRIHTPAMRELLFGEGPEGLISLVEFPFTYLPGPLEGGLESQLEPPSQTLKAIEEQLSEDILRPHSFIALVNSALIFRLDSHQAQLAAKALRAAKHQLRQADSKDQLLTVLRRLATVAAVTRSGELAEELKILTRRWRHEPGRDLSAEEAMWIGLIAAAAHSGLTNWCEFVGEWVTELAFQSLELDEIERLHSHIEYLCQIVPELWSTCGRAEATLSALLST